MNFHLQGYHLCKLYFNLKESPFASTLFNSPDLTTTQQLPMKFPSRKTRACIKTFYSTFSTYLHPKKITRSPAPCGPTDSSIWNTAKIAQNIVIQGASRTRNSTRPSLERRQVLRSAGKIQKNDRARKDV